MCMRNQIIFFVNSTFLTTFRMEIKNFFFGTKKLLEVPRVKFIQVTRLKLFLFSDD